MPFAHFAAGTTATQAELDWHTAMARDLFDMGYEQAADRYLLRLFYRYSLPEGCV